MESLVAAIERRYRCLITRPIVAVRSRCDGRTLTNDSTAPVDIGRFIKTINTIKVDVDWKGQHLTLKFDLKAGLSDNGYAAVLGRSKSADSHTNSVGGNVIMLRPDASEHEMRHEFMHSLGFNEGYRPLGWRFPIDGFEGNIMAVTNGIIQPRDVAVLRDVYSELRSQ